MKKITIAFVSLVLYPTVLALAASAQTYPATPPPIQPAPQQQQVTQPNPQQPGPDQMTTGQYPNLADLRPYSAETDYMSLAGYLRYLNYQRTSQWLTYQEAERVVQQQRGQ